VPLEKTVLPHEKNIAPRLKMDPPYEKMVAPHEKIDRPGPKPDPPQRKVIAPRVGAVFYPV
jgi:hypothetical protein